VRNSYSGRNNVGAYLIGGDYDPEESSIIVCTSARRYVLDASHIKEAAVRELVDVFESMRQTCVESQQHGMAVGGHYDWVIGPQLEPPARNGYP